MFKLTKKCERSVTELWRMLFNGCNVSLVGAKGTGKRRTVYTETYCIHGENMIKLRH